MTDNERNEQNELALTKEEIFFYKYYEQYKEKYNKIKDQEYIYVPDKNDPIGAYKKLTPIEYIYEKYHKKEERQSKKKNKSVCQTCIII